MKLFELQTNLTSYAYPLSKIIISVILGIFCVFRNYIIPISDRIMNFIVTFLCLIILLMCILVLYVSIAEVCHTYSNRALRRVDPSKAVVIPLDSIVSRAEQEDILEIIIWKNNNTIKVGVSSENKHSSAVYENKRYYIEQTEYVSLTEFIGGLLPYSENGNLVVISIDGTCPSDE